MKEAIKHLLRLQTYVDSLGLDWGYPQILRERLVREPLRSNYRRGCHGRENHFLNFLLKNIGFFQDLFPLDMDFLRLKIWHPSRSVTAAMSAADYAGSLIKHRKPHVTATASSHVATAS